MIPEPVPVLMRASIWWSIVSIPAEVSGAFAKLDLPLKVERPRCPCGGR